MNFASSDAMQVDSPRSRGNLQFFAPPVLAGNNAPLLSPPSFSQDGAEFSPSGYTRKSVMSSSPLRNSYETSMAPPLYAQPNASDLQSTTNNSDEKGSVSKKNIQNHTNQNNRDIEADETAKHWSRLLAAGSNLAVSFIQEAMTELINAAKSTRLSGSTVQYVDQRIKISQKRNPFVWSTEEAKHFLVVLKDQFRSSHAALMKPRLNNTIMLSPRSGSITRKSRTGSSELNNIGDRPQSSTRRKVLLKKTPSALLSSGTTSSNVGLSLNMTNMGRPLSLPTKLNFSLGGNGNGNGTGGIGNAIRNHNNNNNNSNNNNNNNRRRRPHSMNLEGLRTPQTRHSPSLSLTLGSHRMAQQPHDIKQQYGYIANAAARRASALSPRSSARIATNNAATAMSAMTTTTNNNNNNNNYDHTFDSNTTMYIPTTPPSNNRKHIEPTESTTNSPSVSPDRSNSSTSYHSNAQRLRTNSPGRTSSFTTTYNLGATLGKGSFSRVVLAQHRSTAINFACKIISTDVLTSPELRALQNEINVLTSIAHPNICNLMEYFVEDHRVCMLFELCPGGELFDAIVRQDHYTEMQASKIMHSLVDGVAYLHSKGIVHRDLKPENILISRSNGDINHLKIADFGFARKCGDQNGALSRVVGTPGYMAPEIGLTNYSLGVDVWSLGIICYILLCGYPPFEADDDEELRNVIRMGNVTFNTEGGWDTIGNSAKDFIMRMLVVNPEQRYDIFQVYQHPWLTSGYDQNLTGSPKQLQSARVSLRKYQAKRRLKASVNVIRAVGRMSALRRRRKEANNRNGNGNGNGRNGNSVGNEDGFGSSNVMMPSGNGEKSSPLERFSMSSFADESGRLSFMDEVDEGRLSQISL